MSTIPSNLEPAIHPFSLIKGDKKEFIYTFPYDISALTFETFLLLKKDRTVEIPSEHVIDGTYDLYVLIDATGEDVADGSYDYGIRHTGDNLPVTCVLGDVSLVVEATT